MSILCVCVVCSLCEVFMIYDQPVKGTWSIIMEASTVLHDQGSDWSILVNGLVVVVVVIQ